MTEENKEPGVGFYLTIGYIVAMYFAYYYFWGERFLDFLAHRLPQ